MRFNGIEQSAAYAFSTEFRYNRQVVNAEKQAILKCGETMETHRNTNRSPKRQQR